MDWQQLREGLRKARLDADLTLDELAKESGIDRSTIHRIENLKKRGKHNPDLDTIEALVVRGMHRKLSDFFLQLETGGSDSVKKEGQSRNDSDIEPRTKSRIDPLRTPGAQVADHGDSVPDDFASLGRRYIELGIDINNTLRELAAAAGQKAVPDDSPPPPHPPAEKPRDRRHPPKRR